MKDQKVIQLYEEGRSTYQIAEHFNTYPNKIRRILTKNGVELKTRSQAQKNALKQGTIPQIKQVQKEIQKHGI